MNASGCSLLASKTSKICRLETKIIIIYIVSKIPENLVNPEISGFWKNNFGIDLNILKDLVIYLGV